MSERTVPRGLVILLLATSAVLLLSVVGLVGYWYGKREAKPMTPPKTSPEGSRQQPQSRFSEKPSPQPVDETAGWETYKSLEAGYSIRYPSSWTVNEWEKKFLTAIDNNVGVVVLTEGENNNYNAQLTVSVSDNGTARKLAEGEQKQGGEEFSLDGVGAFRWFQKNKSQALVIAIKGSYVYRLVLECLNQECYETKKDYYLNVFDQILSTFKFLDQKSADETAGWQVYSHKVMYHPTFSFTFRYPKTATWEEVENWSAGQFVVKVKNPDFTVDVKRLEPNMAENYLGLEASEEVLLNSLPWKIFLAPKGYCDAGDCSPPFVVYQTIKNSYRFAFIFSGTSHKSDSQSKIVSTFGFVE